MFRKYFLLILLPLLAACDKSDSGVVDTTKPPVYHSVPNLKADTLVATKFKDNAYIYDTMYTSADSLNTYIHYKGLVYRLRAYEESGKHFSDSTGFYLCDLFDASDVLINAHDTTPVKVTSSQAFDPIYKLWKPARQTIEVNFTPFPQDAGVYKGKNN